MRSRRRIVSELLASAVREARAPPPSRLIEVGAQGEKLRAPPHEAAPAGVTRPRAEHAARHRVRCVLHVHTRHGAAVSAQRGGFLPLSQPSIRVLSSPSDCDCEGVAWRDEDTPRFVAVTSGPVPRGRRAATHAGRARGERI